MESNTIDLSRFCVSKDYLVKAMTDIRQEFFENAVKQVAKINEKTVEQALIVELSRRIDLVIAQRDELLAALVDCRENAGSPESVYRRAREAIAKCEVKS